MTRKKISIAIALIAFPTMLLTFCTKNNQVLDTTTGPNITTLFSVKGTATLQPVSGAAWDGSIEAVWANATKLSAQAVVPDLGNSTFTGFIGNATDVTIRSLYDADNIYFLVEWSSSQKNLASSPWYFNPTKRAWAQESGAPVKNADSVTYRPPFIQDQFVMMFNIAGSTPGLLSQDFDIS